MGAECQKESLEKLTELATEMTALRRDISLIWKIILIILGASLGINVYDVSTDQPQEIKVIPLPPDQIQERQELP